MKKLNHQIDLKMAKFDSVCETPIFETKYTYKYIFDIKYELIAPIIKDLQIVSQLINYIKNDQLSDLILICGENSYSVDSRFYFNYRHIIDFYVKVTEFFENEYFLKINYNIYKTGPISKKFYATLSLYKNDENGYSSRLELEIILSKNSIINQRILDIIYNELNYNYQYLSQAIKNQKYNLVLYDSSIVKNDCQILSQILQNIKLIEYIINGKLEKNNGGKKEELNNSEYDKFIHLNEIYKVEFNKRKEINNWLSLNNISFKIQFLKTRKDRMTIHFKIISKSKEESKNQTEENPKFNILIVHVRHLTNSSSFVLIKSSWDTDIPKNIIIEIKKLMKKCMNKIQKLCKLAKSNIIFN